ncbi:polysaccharide biosynthesis protein [Brevibacillus ruminantium]|uniref:Polysaccharide biosynthesis protein n=1 Tax=Brevibacillus ruminantium TaxID=2950604 RepID=A0ABY4WJ34_9BACL|nr:nucleoside-diphosphate sugar epimerase/dehydratase [Brevibacillus ruminantium]USG67145.1 polysaccharide biosynthesis protein [Brevibacillus ruminantium]
MTHRKRLLLLCFLDACTIAGAVILACFLRFDFTLTAAEWQMIPFMISAYILLTLAAFHRGKLYHRVWTYASIGELLSIVKMSLWVSGFMFIGLFLLQPLFPLVSMPTSILLISWMLMVLGIGGSRLSWRIFRDSYLIKKGGQPRRNVLIVGAGQAGVLVTSELRFAKGSRYWPVAFIDDDRTQHHLELAGLPILGGKDKIQKAVETYQVQDVVIAKPTASKEEIAGIIDICKTTKVNVKILPSATDVINGKVSIGMIRDVQVEDLLGREPVTLDIAGISSYVSGQVVLVTGAGGSIGSELCRQILRYHPRQLLLLGHGENSIYEIDMELRQAFPESSLMPVIADIQDLAVLEEIFEQYRPKVVFHAAAHKHVPMMEQNPFAAIKNNLFGTRNVADCANLYGASHFVLISTDKAVNPSSIMGVTKRLAELLIQSLNQHSRTKFAAVRFGNVLGSRGSVIPVFKKQILQGGPVTVTHPDMVRYFMTIPEAVQLIIQAGSMAKGGEIFILDMGEPVKIADLARDLISLSGLEPEVDIKIVYSGIRPGEKLFEELLTAKEGILATKHDKIFISEPLPIASEEFHQALEQMELLISAPGTDQQLKEVLALISQLVPEFQRQPANTEPAARQVTAPSSA